MKYDPTRRALYTPEKSDPPAGFSASWPVDHVCAELARLAYYRFEEGDEPRLNAALAAAGFSAATPFTAPRQDAQGFGTLDPQGTVFVAFRGTQAGKPRDLLADAGIRLIASPGGGSIHQGFLGAYSALRDVVAQWLEDFDGRRLIVTGHSLGAAMATVMAGERESAELVTFGSPRVGDADYVARFEGRLVRRYVDCTDEVTRVPPELIRYRHVGGERYIDRLGTVHAVPPPADAIREDRAAARRAYLAKYAWQVWRNVLVRDLADHAPVNYVSAVLGRREPD